MPKNSLLMDSADLAHYVETASGSIQRQLALALCRSAVAQLLPDDKLVEAGLAGLEKGNYGDPTLAAALEAHVEALDDEYWRAQDAKQEFFPLFAKARAANAVLYALDPDPFAAVTHGLYEICAASGVDWVKAEVERVTGCQFPAVDGHERNPLYRESPALARRMEDTTPIVQRAVTLALCKWAVAQKLPDDAVVRTGIAALKRGEYGGAELLRTLDTHWKGINQAFFDVREAGGESYPIFVKARVANAVFFALDADPLKAATNALRDLCVIFGARIVEAEVDRVLIQPT